jgi:elongator complex protein 4
MSSFRRAVSNSSSKSSTDLKSWINGQYLVSSGHRQLDEILGGGIALGTMVLIEEDVHTRYGETLLSYSLAESISQGHCCILCGTDVQRLCDKLPYNSTRSGNEAEGNQITSQKDQKEGVKEEEGALRIAWQYGKYLNASE